MKIYGINSDSETCSCCGKTWLKKVVWIGEDDGDPAPYGVNCVAWLWGVKQTTKGRTEAAIENAMLDQIRAAKSALINSLPNYQGYAMPADLCRRHDLTLEEKVIERTKRYPIFNERLSVKERLNYV